MREHLAYVISQPFPASGMPGYQAICPTCGVLSHDGHLVDAQGVADQHSLFHTKTPPRHSKPVTAAEVNDLRRRQREIEEALA